MERKVEWWVETATEKLVSSPTPHTANNTLELGPCLLGLCPY